MVSSSYPVGSRSFSTKVKTKKSQSRWSLSLYLILFAVIQLNFQKVLYDLLGIPLDSGTSHPILLIWAFMLLTVLALSVVRICRLVRVQRIEAWVALFLLVCVSHGLVLGATSGLTTGIFSFLAWGIGVGVFFQVGRDSSCDGPRFVIFVLVLSGVVNAVPVLWESVMGVTIYKHVTLASQTRMYGISQSVSILGVQLAVGIIASTYLLFTTKRRILTSIIIGIQVWALIASTSRGPFIYMIFVLFTICLLLPSSTEKKMLWALLLCALASFALLFATQLQIGIEQSFLLTALTFEDAGNRERLEYYQAAQEVLFSSFPELMLGHGSGVFSIVQVRSGGEEFGTESSVLKILLELGIFGAVPFFAVVIGTLRTGLKNWIKKRDMGSLFLLGCFMVVLMQFMTHELLKAWIGSAYFWLIAGGLLHTKVFHPDSQRLDKTAAK